MITPNKEWAEEVEDKTVAALTQLAEDYWDKRREAEALDKTLKEIKAERDALAEKLQDRLLEEGLPKYSSPSGMVSLSEEIYVTTPKSFSEKKEFFDWLSKQGVFYDYATVNYNSLQSLYKEQKQVSGEANFSLPGIGPEQTRIKLRAYAQK